MLRSAPTSRRSIQTRRCLRLESLENRYMLSHPAVAAVNVAGTNWASSFVSYLESSGFGTGGYAIPAGSSQLQTLPWTNINQVRIKFSENVTIAAADLSISGVNKTAYVFSGFNYDPNTFTATWTLDAPITKDKLMLDLDADGMAPVRSVSTNDVLDGAWTDCQSTFNSGNGQGGTDFQFRFNVLPGDANASNTVSVVDATLVNQKVGKNVGDTGYNIRYDVDGSGGITSGDVSAVQSKAGGTLPSGNPIGMTNDAPTTSGITGVSVATNAVDHVVSLPDFFADAETASDDLAYSIVNNTNASLFDALNINSSGDLNLDFAANTAGNATLTIRATDAAGLIVDTTLAVHVDNPPTTSGIPAVSVATNTANHVVSLPDSFADVETASNNLVYSVINNTNASLFNSLNIDSSGNLNLAFAANTAGNAILTIRATDAAGLSVDTTLAVHVSDAPFISNFYCVQEYGNFWTLSGTVTDNDDAVEDYVITFGGELESYHLTTTAEVDGVFSLTVELTGLQQGTGTAQTHDPHGVLSNLAMDYIIA